MSSDSWCDKWISHRLLSFARIIVCVRPSSVARSALYRVLLEFTSDQQVYMMVQQGKVPVIASLLIYQNNHNPIVLHCSKFAGFIILQVAL